MPTPDLCIAGIYEPGNIGSSVGEPVTVPVAGSLLDPSDYDPDAVEYSLDFTKFYNSGYLLLLMV
jgi:hypothetical protein